MVHILHYVPERRAQQIDTIQDIVPLHDVRIALRCDKAPSRVCLAPDEAELPCEWSAGYAEASIPVVNGYAVAVFED